MILRKFCCLRIGYFVFGGEPEPDPSAEVNQIIEGKEAEKKKTENVENKEVNVEHSLCDKYFEETLETADPESSKYNPSNPQYMPEPLPKTVLDWFNSQRLDWIRSKSNK